MFLQLLMPSYHPERRKHCIWRHSGTPPHNPVGDAMAKNYTSALYPSKEPVVNHLPAHLCSKPTKCRSYEAFITKSSLVYTSSFQFQDSCSRFIEMFLSSHMLCPFSFKVRWTCLSNPLACSFRASSKFLVSCAAHKTPLKALSESLSGALQSDRVLMKLCGNSRLPGWLWY